MVGLASPMPMSPRATLSPGPLPASPMPGLRTSMPGPGTPRMALTPGIGMRATLAPPQFTPKLSPRWAPRSLEAEMLGPPQRAGAGGLDPAVAAGLALFAAAADEDWCRGCAALAPIPLRLSPSQAYAPGALAALPAGRNSSIVSEQ